MYIVDLNEDTLKDLIFEHLLVEANNYKYSDTYFSFVWNDSKTHIIYEDVDLIVYGNSCWEDSKEEKENTKCSFFNHNNFGEFFDSFLIPDYIIHKKFEDNIPQESFNALIVIKENIEILKNSPKSLEQIRKVSPEDFLDLLNILHKYIPESLNKYFSIPDRMKKQTHRNGKNSHELLNETFISLQGRFEDITKNLVSEKINELKTYQTFIHNKFD